MTFQTHRLETNVNKIMMTDQIIIMKAQRAKNAGKNNANIAKSLLPIWDIGKLKAITAKAISACSIPIMGLPTMWPTFWLGPSMARLLVGPREEQNCRK